MPQILHHCLRFGLGSVFVFSGIVKLGDVSGFAKHVGSFGLVFDELVTSTAWSICLLEVALGAALVANLRGSLTGLAGLLSVFTAALAYGMWLGLDIDCGCFGPAYQVSLKTQLAIDLGLFCWCGLVHISREAGNVRTIRLGKLLGDIPTHRERTQ